MFDIGFSELALIAVVALIVVGPERLPKVARTAGHLLGRLQRYVSDVKADINREMQVEDLKKLQQQVAEQAKDMEQSVGAHMKSVETSLNESIAQGIADKPETAAATDSAGVSPPLTSAGADKPKV
ncbi:MAG: Sec-independent protein translocase protein TatB [Gammaproteobacteria bacterium]|nr:Sec-independent protein translocase protein TatB [Gammaproteobacteria bacterium]MBU1415817.1 Sec-independent protein translocase protein TatB [Gammaproteobacteria bacterium]